MIRRRRISHAVSLCVVAVILHAQEGTAAAPQEWRKLILPQHDQLRSVVRDGSAGESGEGFVIRAAIAADDSFSPDELSAVVRIATACCSASHLVSRALTEWLREDHRLYAGRLPTDASQFRGFLLASLGAFPPNDALYEFVRAELQFGGHPFSVAAAAVAARQFPDRSDELMPLLERYLDSNFEDHAVDITTPELAYPLARPTRARHEIIRTMVAFGPRAYRAVVRLEAIARCPTCGTYGADVALPRKAIEAAHAIRELTPACCRKDAPDAPDATPLRIVDRRHRRRIDAASLRLIDQEGRSLRFTDLRGHPFVLTFFYSQCPNMLKCVMTVRRLAALARECAEKQIAGKVGIYGMTLDPHFDSPSILKKYGSMHGMEFDSRVRLLKTTGSIPGEIAKALSLRVSYGAGSVNQHGVQVFVFDREGRLAATHDNELWSTSDVTKVLTILAAE